MFDYDAASDTFTPGTLADHPQQGNDAKCGFACHTSVKARDYAGEGVAQHDPALRTPRARARRMPLHLFAPRRLRRPVRKIVLMAG
jgi:hypothetical protein